MKTHMVYNYNLTFVPLCLYSASYILVTHFTLLAFLWASSRSKNLNLPFLPSNLKMIDTPSNEQSVWKTEKMAQQVKVIAPKSAKLEF